MAWVFPCQPFLPYILEPQPWETFTVRWDTRQCMKLPHCALRARLRAGQCCCVCEPSQVKGVGSFVGEAPISITLDPCVETSGGGDDAGWQWALKRSPLLWELTDMQGEQLPWLPPFSLCLKKAEDDVRCTTPSLYLITFRQCLSLTNKPEAIPYLRHSTGLIGACSFYIF